MDEDLAAIVAQVLRSYRHLMTESERRADRAFAFAARLESTTDEQVRAEAEAALRQALADPLAAELFQKGWGRFLEDLAQRVLAEHSHVLPRCSQCGAVLRQPNPKTCFDCR